MLAIYKRELRSYFYSPVAYIFLVVLMSFFGLFFLLYNILPRIGIYGLTPATANFSYVVDSLVLVLVFVLPILVMRLISDERRQKTDQLLHTVPISTFEIVLAKYLSALTVFGIGLLVSLIYPLILFILADAYLKYLWAVYIGFFLLGGSFIAICLFASSLTESQVVSATLGFFFILMLWLVQFLGDSVNQPWFKSVTNWVSILKRFEDLRAGMLTLSPIVYYLSIIVIFLFLTARTMDKRRWTEG
jgi:ABC-2 type transport system permease protein